MSTMQRPADVDVYPNEYSVSYAQQRAAAALAEAAAHPHNHFGDAHDGYELHHDDDARRPVFTPTPSRPYPDLPGTTPTHESRGSHGGGGGRVLSAAAAAAQNELLDPGAAAMHDLHHRAIKAWWKRVKCCFALHMVRVWKAAEVRPVSCLKLTAN
jgi:hypothetical protein